MHNKTRTIKVLISCPSDVNAEKQIVKDVCAHLTSIYSRSKNITIIPIEYDRDVVSSITGQGPQAVINDQFDKHDCDLYIGILWKRFGDKQTNGLTPTKEEFKIYFEKYQKFKKPQIGFYFSVKKLYPSNIYEAEQLVDVLKFKDYIGSLGVYKETYKEEGDFRQKINNHFISFIEDIDTIIEKELSIPKKQYSTVPDYISRKMFPVKDSNSTDLFFLDDGRSLDIFALLKKHNRIVLLSNAGVGKTTELQQIAGQFSKDDSPYYPFLIPLNLYEDQKISDFLPENWNDIPDNRLLLIFDGLDEVESKQKNTAIRQIRFFSSQHPDAHIVVSCRTNFYSIETEQSSGTLEEFSSYLLLPLDEKGIKEHIEKKLDKRAKKFIDPIKKNNLHDLLKVPFYLIRLLELFATDLRLPQSKAEIFELLLIYRIQLDVNHFTTIELDEKKKTVVEILERLALGMELLGRNYIITDDYHTLIPNESHRKLINHCTVWNKKDGEAVRWQFEHNNIQEYLAAKALSRRSLDQIKAFVSFEPDYKKVIPSWVNTYSGTIGMQYCNLL